MTFTFDPTRNFRTQLDEIGVDWDLIREAADEYDKPEAELVQFWLDLYGERDADALKGPVTKDDLCGQPNFEWKSAVHGYSWEEHSAAVILEIADEIGYYDPSGEYGSDSDAARASVIASEAEEARSSKGGQGSNREVAS